MNILVCDDDREIVDAIEIYLMPEGYHVFKAYDGIQAIEILKKEDIQLLLIDVMMPRMDGIEAAGIICDENIAPGDIEDSGKIQHPDHHSFRKDRRCR